MIYTLDLSRMFFGLVPVCFLKKLLKGFPKNKEYVDYQKTRCYLPHESFYPNS